MEISIPRKDRLYIETAPKGLLQYRISLLNWSQTQSTPRLVCPEFISQEAQSFWNFAHSMAVYHCHAVCKISKRLGIIAAKAFTVKLISGVCPEVQTSTQFQNRSLKTWSTVLAVFKTQSKKMSVLLPWISNHKHKIEEKFKKSSQSSSKVVCFGLTDWQ